MKPVPTALETDKCPPHYWKINAEKVGTCPKCGAVKDFGALQRREERLSIPRATQSRGGRKKKGGLK